MNCFGAKRVLEKEREIEVDSKKKKYRRPNSANEHADAANNDIFLVLEPNRFDSILETCSIVAFDFVCSKWKWSELDLLATDFFFKDK